MTDIETLTRELRKIKSARSGLGWRRLAVLLPQTDIVIDVGASDGTPDLYGAFPDSEFVIIDAIEENRPVLESFADRYKCRVIISGVGAAAGRQTFNIAGNAAGSRSSFLKRHGAFEDDAVEAREIAIARLDALVRPDDRTIGLKLDVEGYEAEALKGASELLPLTQWVIAEVSLAPRFKGDPMFEGVDDLLKPHGFVFRDIVSIRRNRAGDLRLIDAVFVRRHLVEYPRTSSAKRRKG